MKVGTQPGLIAKETVRLVPACQGANLGILLLHPSADALRVLLKDPLEQPLGTGTKASLGATRLGASGLKLALDPL